MIGVGSGISSIEVSAAPIRRLPGGGGVRCDGNPSPICRRSRRPIRRHDQIRTAAEHVLHKQRMLIRRKTRCFAVADALTECGVCTYDAYARLTQRFCDRPTLRLINVRTARPDASEFIRHRNELLQLTLRQEVRCLKLPPEPLGGSRRHSACWETVTERCAGRSSR